MEKENKIIERFSIAPCQKIFEMSIGPTVMRKEPIIYVHYFSRGSFYTYKSRYCLLYFSFTNHRNQER